MMIKISDHLYEAAARLRGNNNFDNILEEIEKIIKAVSAETMQERDDITLRRQQGAVIVLSELSDALKNAADIIAKKNKNKKRTINNI